MKEKLVKIALKDIEPNPNRDLKFNPFNEEKIAALMASIGETGFWTNVIVRGHPDKPGKYQQAYGHHRLHAAIRAGIKEADFVVRDLDESMMLKMMELENQEDYRYCPLSLLESVKAVVNALAARRIAPFYSAEDAEGNIGAAKNIRYAPSFVPKKHSEENPLSAGAGEAAYTAYSIATYLGRTRKSGHKNTLQADPTVCAALDALYLLEVKAITTAQIKDMNWAILGKFVADIKAKRERVILVERKTKEQLAEIAEKSRRLQEEHRAKEKKAKEEREALVKKMAEAKREEDKKKAKEIAERIAVKEATAVEDKLDYEVKSAELDKKVEEVKQKQIEAKKEDEYLPIRKETDRIVHLLERRDEEEVVKALARKYIKPQERERLRQAAISKGTWYLDFVAQQFLPPLSVKSKIEDYRRREETKRRAEETEKAKEKK